MPSPAGLLQPVITRYEGSTGTNHDTQPQGEAQVYQPNAFVFLDATGRFVTCDETIPGNITKVHGIDTVGAATAGNMKRVEPVSSQTEVLMSLYNFVDPLLAVTSQALVGKKFAIKAVTVSGIRYWVVAHDNVIDQIVQVTKIAPNFPMGTIQGAVYVKVLKSLLQYQP
jgi:hypothetical protein